MVLGVVVWFRGSKLAIVSVYIHHTMGEGVDELSRALTRASGASEYALLGADCNGHSPLWGPQSSRTDSVGSLVEGVLAESNLLVLNSSDSPATFRTDSGHEFWINTVSGKISPEVLPDAILVHSGLLRRTFSCVSRPVNMVKCDIWGGESGT